MLYFPGKWDSLFLIKYFLSKLLLHPQSFPLPPIFFFCFLFSIFSNYLGLLLFLVHDLICKTQVNILKIFQTALCFISKNQLHIAQAVAESTSPWQNCNSAGNVKESCLQPDQSITFSLLFKIAQSVTGHSDHLVIGKSKAVQKQKLLLGENRCCQFTNGRLVFTEMGKSFLFNKPVSL